MKNSLKRERKRKEKKKMTSRTSNSSGSSNGGRAKAGKYELGRTLGEGNFAKVKFARHVETGDHVAIKILDKEKILKHKMIRQVNSLFSCLINYLFFYFSFLGYYVIDTKFLLLLCKL